MSGRAKHFSIGFGGSSLPEQQSTCESVIADMVLPDCKTKHFAKSDEPRDALQQRGRSIALRPNRMQVTMNSCPGQNLTSCLGSKKYRL